MVVVGYWVGSKAADWAALMAAHSAARLAESLVASTAVMWVGQTDAC